MQRFSAAFPREGQGAGEGSRFEASSLKYRYVQTVILLAVNSFSNRHIALGVSQSQSMSGTPGPCLERHHVPDCCGTTRLVT